MPSLISPQKLRDHVEASHRRLKVERDNRREAYQEYAGRHSYRDDGKKRHLNLFSRAIGKLIPHVASREAENLVETDRTDITGEAMALGLFLDRHARLTKRRLVSRLALQDAFLGPKAILMIAEKAGSNIVKVSARGHQRGGIVLKSIDLDNYVCDPGARCDDEMLWEGFFYDVLKDEAIESTVFDPSIKDLPLAQDSNRGQHDQLQDLSANGVTKDDRYGLVDRLTLLDIVMYDDDGSWLVTVPADVDYSGDFLRVERYEGPGRGPLEKLEFHPVNGQPHGKPPASDWRENAEAFYTIVNKFVEEAQHAKQLLLARKGVNEAEVDAIEDAVDRAVVMVDDPGAFNNVTMGLVNKDLVAVAGQLDQYNVTSSDQPDILGGDKDGSSTATEYSGKSAAAATVIGDYQDTHDDFEGRVSARIAFYGQHDPRFTKPITFMAAGSEVAQIHFDPSRRIGEYDEFTFKIVPRSMSRQDPDVQALRYMQFFDRILKAAQVTVTTGGMIDVAGAARVFGDMAGLKKLPEMIHDPVLAMERMMAMRAVPPSQPGQVGPPQGPRGGTPGVTRSQQPQQPADELQQAQAPAMAGAA